jgi:hypothetical protein
MGHIEEVQSWRWKKKLFAVVIAVKSLFSPPVNRNSIRLMACKMTPAVVRLVGPTGAALVQEMAAVPGRCIQLPARNAVLRLRFLSNQPKGDRFIVAIATLNKRSPFSILRSIQL